jgi:hypothetical protein
MAVDFLRYNPKYNSYKTDNKKADSMKIDVNYIKQILEILESIDSPTMYSKDLYDKMREIAPSNDNDSKFIKHIWDLRDLGAIESNNYDMGFRQGANGDWIMNGCFYRLTMRGQQLLDVMRNDTWWNRIKSSGKEITMELLKQAPSIIIDALISR